MADKEKIENAEFEVVEGEESKSMMDDIDSWLSTLPEDNEGLLAVLYKYKNPNTTKYKYAYQWQDEIPDAHDIGLRFGSGRYNLMLKIQDEKGKKRKRSYKFEIDSFYDEIRRKKRLSPDTPLGSDENESDTLVYNGQPPQPQNGLEASMQVFERVVGMLVPLIGMDRKNNSNNFNPGEFMMKTYDGVGKVLQKNLSSQADMVNAIAKSQIIGEEEEVDEEGTGNEILDMIKPFMENFIPVLKKDGVNSRMAAKTIKSLPQYKELIGNKKALNEVINYLVEKEGKEGANKILTNLKIRTVQ